MPNCVRLGHLGKFTGSSYIKRCATKWFFFYNNLVLLLEWKKRAEIGGGRKITKLPVMKLLKEGCVKR